jgi:PIN domain nuclease of toxin-antitoxin system
LPLIIDTHALIWIGAANPKFSKTAKAAVETPGETLFVSGITAWEYVDLWLRGRIPEASEFALLKDMLGFKLLDFPAQAWTIAALLPAIHRDPIDRMLIAHAIIADLTLVTIDSDMRKYPVKTIW